MGSEDSKTVVIRLTQVELMEVERILLDEDGAAALKFLKKRLSSPARGALAGRGENQPWFESPTGVTSTFREAQK